MNKKKPQDSTFFTEPVITRLVRDYVLTDSDRERLWSFIEKTDGCWPWTGGRGKGKDNYGRFNLDGKHVVRVHRLVYTLMVGPIPAGLHLRHTCDNPPCVNPEHLIPSTRAENMADMKAKGRGSGRFKDVPKCASGHDFDEANTYYWNGHRQCRKCKIAWSNEYARNKRREQRALLAPQTCRVCNVPLQSSSGKWRVYCSTKCANAYWNGRKQRMVA